MAAVPPPVRPMFTMRSESAKGKGRRITVLTTVNIAVFAAMPMASEATAVMAKLGLCRKTRSECLRSFRKDSMARPHAPFVGGGIVPLSQRRVQQRRQPRARSFDLVLNYRVRQALVRGIHRHLSSSRRFRQLSVHHLLRRLVRLLRPRLHAPLGPLLRPLLRQVLGKLREQLVFLRSEEHTSELQSPCNLVC